MNWDLRVDRGVKKFLKKIPKKDAGRISWAIRLFGLNPYEGDIEKMEGEENAWRRRVGTYRVFYEIYVSRRIIHVFKAERRGSKTY